MRHLAPDRPTRRRTPAGAGRRRAVVAILVASLVAAGCNGGGKATATTTLASSTTMPAPTTTASVTSSSGPTTTGPDLTVRAKAATLQQDDFPPGFPAQPDDPTQGLKIDPLWADLTACLGAPPPSAATSATSPTFRRGLATQGRSTVEYASEAAVAATSGALNGPKLQTCLDQSFVADLNRSKPEGTTAGPVTVTRRPVPAVGSSPVFSLRINASVILTDLPIKLFQDFFVIFKGGAVIRMFFLNPGAEFPQDLERSLVEKVVNRA